MSAFSFQFALFAVLLLGFFSPAWAPCPHCNGNFASCNYETTKKCGVFAQVEANVAVVAAGVGAISLTGLLRPRFLRLFTRVSFDTILTLVKRNEPGTPFTIEASTSANSLLTAIANGQTTLDAVVCALADLIENETDSAKATKLTRKLECLKLCGEVRNEFKGRSQGSSSTLFDTGVLTFLWAKISVFVMTKGMQIKLQGSEGKEGEKVADLTAKL